MTTAWSAGVSNAAAHYQYDANGNRTGRTYHLQTSPGLWAGWTDIGAPYHCTTNGTYSVDQALGTSVLFRARVQRTE